VPPGEVVCSAPAGAPILCPDESGVYSPDACDLIEPFDNPPGSVACDAIDMWTGQGLCAEWWQRETTRDRALGILFWAELAKGYELERLDRQEVERLNGSFRTLGSSRGATD
jgi:hypothetical protein